LGSIIICASAATPDFILEKDVVRAVGVERRVEVDQVYALVGKILPQDGKIVAAE
jgi:hypothetical protein